MGNERDQSHWISSYGGGVDDLAIWNRVVSDQELRFIYTRGLDGLRFVVPEPSTLALLILGLAALGGMRRGRK